MRKTEETGGQREGEGRRVRPGSMKELKSRGWLLEGMGRLWGERGTVRHGQ